MKPVSPLDRALVYFVHAFLAIGFGSAAVIVGNDKLGAPSGGVTGSRHDAKCGARLESRGVGHDDAIG